MLSCNAKREGKGRGWKGREGEGGEGREGKGIYDPIFPPLIMVAPNLELPLNSAAHFSRDLEVTKIEGWTKTEG